MMVKELIEKLQEYPDYLTVELVLEDVDLVEAAHEVDNVLSANIITYDEKTLGVEQVSIDKLIISATGC
ncbi:hypothetical protein KUG02_05495 [Streptococcus equi subsp. zooepidemicus]|uniref:Uncharacterized protein n=2 Tax=Streptococcus equi TaxID=1336 RepID=A0A922NXJ0_9STRE|nr:hypothetical protein [Streptococcus equi]QBX24306.1 hypothetical protein Javan182_0036 [Streptococcus phage Javan182]KED05310.1 hypothetical protein CECT5772_00706 [Streptococcus equi subsp. ruminatorum CECT 5772]MCD3381697.1 hypothetical protein [Streptococcus equi subsp. zooepidemicus]MCD3386892.1 hypothetical protein [Streptococcus equi subsp. zooepidemicus]MCD3406703.1 hypothetical protein [Streptococcus equi subsp. zooepidemicus]